MYATVMTPKIAPGEFVQHAVLREPGLFADFGASTIDVIPANLASVVDAFISILP